MRCRRVRRFLPPFVGEDLPSSLGARIREHLRDCHPCARAFAADREARTALREGLRSPEPPADLWDRIETGLLAEGRSRRFFPPRIAPRSVAAAGVFLAVALAGTYLLSRPGETSLSGGRIVRPASGDVPAGDGLILLFHY